MAGRVVGVSTITTVDRETQALLGSVCRQKIGKIFDKEGNYSPAQQQFLASDTFVFSSTECGHELGMQSRGWRCFNSRCTPYIRNIYQKHLSETFTRNIYQKHLT